MSVIIHKDTKIIIQGFTGKMGTFHAEEMIKYGSNVVGGVTPGKGGQKHLDRPVFDTVKDAVKNTGATASILFVPPAFAADSAMEAADAGIKTCVAIVDGIPSTIATQVFIPASAASIAESAAKAGGTNNIDAVAPVCFTASLTVLNTGLSKCF